MATFQRSTLLVEKVQRQIAMSMPTKYWISLGVPRKIKSLFIKGGVSLSRCKWSGESGRTKVLIQVNQKFSEARWRKLINDTPTVEAGKYEFVFCRNKFETIKNFTEADFCFLFGFSRFLVASSSKRQLVYIPMFGRDMLNSITLPPNVQVTGPKVDLAPAAIAEYCLGMLIAFCRSLHKCEQFKSSRTWNQQPFLNNTYQALSQKVIGVLGMGKVGKRIARAFHALGCRVLACSRNVRQSDFIYKWYNRNELKVFLRNINVLVVALPLTGETRNIISAPQLACLSTGSIIINISRGAVICRSALIDWLRSDSDNGAILDVFSREPVERKSPLFKLQNVILTPHISGNINLFIEDIQLDFINQITAKDDL